MIVMVPATVSAGDTVVLVLWIDKKNAVVDHPYDVDLAVLPESD